MSSLVPYSDARSKLEANSALSAYPIAWQNEPFVPPDPSATQPIWLSVETEGRFYQPIELGGGCWEEDGAILVHVVTPTGQGSDTPRTVAKAVADTFRGLTAGNVVYLGGSIGTGASDPEGMYWILTVVVRFRYQDIET